MLEFLEQNGSVSESRKVRDYDVGLPIASVEQDSERVYMSACVH